MFSIPSFRENKHEFDGFLNRLFSSDNQSIKPIKSTSLSNIDNIKITQSSSLLNIIKFLAFVWVLFVVIGYIASDGKCVTNYELEFMIDMVNDQTVFHIYFLKITLILTFLWFINFLTDSLDTEYNKIIVILLFASVITNLNFLFRCHL